MSDALRRMLSRAWRIAAGYAVFASLWILLSDHVLALLVPDPEALVRAGVYKGVAFVAITAVLLFFVLRRVFGELERNYESLREHAEAARSEREFSETMIESTPGVIYFYDEQGGILRWNRNFESVTGYTGAEIARMHPLGFFEPGEQPRVAERIAEAFSRGSASLEAQFRAKDGSATPYFFTGRRVVFGGRPCLVGMGIDITERRQAEQALRQGEERYRTTLDSIFEGCQLIGFDWRYLYLNEAAERHNRRPNAELLGRRMPDVWPGIEQTAVYGMFRRCLEQRDAGELQVEFEFPDGSRGWFDVRVQPAPEGALILSQEITEWRQAQAALHELNLTLEQQVLQRTSELAAALVRAEDADRMKSAFLATMSHELRTPLNSIIGFTGILLQKLAGPLSGEQEKQLTMVQGSARHLLELINDVLDLSKIEAGQLEVRAEQFSLPASVERVVGMVQPLAGRKSLQVTLDVAPGLGRMQSDRRRVEQILLNLLNNAIKFTDRGGIQVIVEQAADWAPAPGAAPVPAARFRVRDTGIGMSEEDLGSLFQPFRQLDSGLTRQHEGTGLGLAICRRLAALLGGEITARSQPWMGSEFCVTLPLEMAN